MKELVVNGMCIAPSVVETVVTRAVSEIEGVTKLIAPNAAATGFVGALTGAKNTPQKVVSAVDENDQLRIAVRIEAVYGNPLPELAARVREAVANAIATQIGVPVGAVDVYVDSMQFNA
ncbi:MAG: Asp23/Gls24 family envelope stress response protein [Coriobacteriia bacterium]|nr:Asp23/Gls24 family envelope stress response protein [Coriobacteriia bacterium]